MAKSRLKASPITAYGTEDDRRRVEAIISTTNDKSVSKWIIRKIREEYKKIFGDKPP